MRYDAGRAIGTAATNALNELVVKHAGFPVSLIVDLGCGTGRFTAALSETFNARVVGIEPAANMRAAAEAKSYRRAVRFVEGSAECIPLEDGTADLVFMSQVFHHLVDRVAALGEIHRVLRPGGRLYLRQTTKENLDSYFYQQFFPEARAVDERRLPARDTLIGLATSCRYQMVAVETQRYEVAATSGEYVARVGQRAYSDLESISEDAFSNGLCALRRYSNAFPGFPRTAENDIFIFAA